MPQEVALKKRGVFISPQRFGWVLGGVVEKVRGYPKKNAFRGKREDEKGAVPSN